jgi:TonB family protein
MEIKMNPRVVAILSFSVLILAFTTRTSLAQAIGTAQDGTAGQNGVSETAKDSEKVKGEVDLKLDELNSQHAMVLGRCLQGEKCKPLKGEIVDGRTIKGDVVDGKAIDLPQPPYPAIAKAAHASGRVEVQVIIDEEGKVIAAQAISGHPLLHAAALKSAREARFTPTLLDGKPVKVAGVIDYTFNL